MHAISSKGGPKIFKGGGGGQKKFVTGPQR